MLESKDDEKAKLVQRIGVSGMHALPRLPRCQDVPSFNIHGGRGSRPFLFSRVPSDL